MCKAAILRPSAGKTGSCFPDETTLGLQYVFRIPLPHQGIVFIGLPLCGDPDSGTAEFYRRRAFLCHCIRTRFRPPIGATPPAN